MIRRALVFCLIGATGAGHAAEGFHALDAPSPPAVVVAWNSTFALTVKNPLISSLGTAFLVRAEQIPGATELYFLTNRHVLAPACTTTGVCPVAHLAEDARLSLDHKTRFVLEAYRGLRFHPVEILKLSVNPDLALLRVIVPGVKAQFPPPLKVATNDTLTRGQFLYAVGFPLLWLRDPIESRRSPRTTLIAKRWSAGVYVETRSAWSGGWNITRLVATTVDALAGVSGGPLLNAAGEVVGVIKSSASTDENNYRFEGDEAPHHLKFESNAVPARYLEDFIATPPSAN